MARSICSRGSCGKSRPASRVTIFLNCLTSFFRSAASRSTSTVTPLACFAASSASSKRSPSTPRTVLPNIWMRRRYESHANRSSPRLGCEADDGRVGEADVENRVHHAGHRELRAGADGYQQRVVGLAELLAHLLLEGVEVRTDLVAQRPRLLAAVEVDLARLGGDGEARRDGQPEVGHLGEVGALPAEQVLQILVALGEVINELLTLELRGGYVGIFVFRHGSRLLEDAGGCPDGQEHTQIEGAWVRPLARHAALTTRPPADRKLRRVPPPGHAHSTLELIITQGVRDAGYSAR